MEFSETARAAIPEVAEEKRQSAPNAEAETKSKDAAPPVRDDGTPKPEVEDNRHPVERVVGIIDLGMETDEYMELIRGRRTESSDGTVIITIPDIPGEKWKGAPNPDAETAAENAALAREAALPKPEVGDGTHPVDRVSGIIDLGGMDTDEYMELIRGRRC